MRRRASVLAAAAVILLAAPATPALAWGSSGHRLVGLAAMGALPDETPAFLRTPTAAADVGELSREPDRSKGAGKVHDSNRDPGHFLDIEDDGRVLAGPRYDALPPTRAEYEAALEAAGQDSWKAGYLPYSIIEEQQQLAKDFGYWRALYAAEGRTADPGRRAWFAEDRRRREAQILATIGRLSHFVGDGAQPLHVTAHYNGWGDYPNPKGFTRAKVHGPIEGEFVAATATLAAVQAAMAPLRVCDCPVEVRTAQYLGRGFAQVEPFYALEKAGGFQPADSRGAAFVVRQLGEGASELRDRIVEAWRAGGRAQVGWPAVSVADVEAGLVDPFDALFGVD